MSAHLFIFSRFLQCAAAGRQQSPFKHCLKWESQRESQDQVRDLTKFNSLIELALDSHLPSSLSCKSFLHDRLFCRATCALSALARELSHDFAPLPPSLPLPDMHRPLSLLFLRYRESGGISRRHKMQVVTASFLSRFLCVEESQLCLMIATSVNSLGPYPADSGASTQR